MPQRIETPEPEGVDYTWVMQVTFLASLVVGVPVVVVASLGRTLPTWTDKALFSVRVGAVLWLFIGIAVYAYARRRLEAD